MRGSRSVLSCEPPSGKIPMQLPLASAECTDENIPDWSTYPMISYVAHLPGVRVRVKG